VPDDLISKAESLFIERLENWFTYIFRNTNLPSHDITHHRRVWRYAKELIKSLSETGYDTTDDLTCKLIIACYLHDSGMALDRGPKHGTYSREFCLRFLTDNDLDIDNFSDVPEVISRHDDKEYIIKGIPTDLITILSVSDDLDALGLTGIYRYSEIYIERGTDLKKIGDLVLKNIALRYNHFIESFGFDKNLVKKHKKRYNEVVSFFEEYNRQVKDYQFNGNELSGNCGVIEVIANTIKRKQFSIEDIIKTGVNEDDEKVKVFFSKLEIELES
jgi:HD superfamily phosphodiesterase